jgi:hypothetical protein
MDYKSIISSFLPHGILDHFDIVEQKEQDCKVERPEGFYIYLEEKNVLPVGYDNSTYESKGFYKEKTIQDFPVRGKALYLVVKRRRWRLKSDPKVIIKSDYSFIAEGAKLTQEVADFLKGTGRDPRRYDK